tara:strand:- start:691 stop:888 length:198 start_codon:yes stop_codon:yes gene_type:complete
MANIELKFIDENQSDITARVFVVLNSIKISISYGEIKKVQSIYFDKSTAIKFAKTLRTEINKMEG